MGSQTNSHPPSVTYNKVCTVWGTNCLEIHRDLMTYEGKINHSAKTQKVLTKPAGALEKRGHPAGGGEHLVMGCAGALLGQYLPSLLNVCSIRGWQIRPSEDLNFYFPWPKWWWCISWWKLWAWVRKKGKTQLEGGKAENRCESKSSGKVLIGLNLAQGWSKQYF